MKILKTIYTITISLLLLTNAIAENEINLNKAFDNNCKDNLNLEKRIASITLGNQAVDNRRAFFTIALYNVTGTTAEISILESVGNDYGKAMFQLINSAYLSNSNIKITRCEENRIAGLTITSK